jgi:hypothetical protein
MKGDKLTAKYDCALKIKNDQAAGLLKTSGIFSLYSEEAKILTFFSAAYSNKGIVSYK